MMVLTRTKIFLLGTAAVALLTAAVLGVAYREQIGAWTTESRTGVVDSAAAEPVRNGLSTEGEREILYWYDPMHPAYKSNKPGIAPDCGMQLVPRYADEVEALQGRAPGTVYLSPAKQQLIGVRTATVTAEPVTKVIRATGLVEMDETRVTHVHTKVSGWVRRVFVDYTWQHVEKGAPLFTVYSPELVSVQKEYLLARRAQAYLGEAPYREAAEGSASLLRAAGERLRLWDVTAEQIAELEARGVPQEELTFYSPVMGHVAERNVFPNQYVTPETKLYTIVDHSHVWVQTQLFEYEIEAVRVGQAATMTVTALPGRIFRGRVHFVDPHLDMSTRSVNVRLEFPNPALSLKPGMFATVSLSLPLGRRVVVPRDAVVETGTRQLIFLARPGGYFEPRQIQTGPHLGPRVVVLSGLDPGETIVTSGVFLIDSESQFRAATEALGSPH